MTTERATQEVATEYKRLSLNLQGYRHDQGLHEEFTRLHQLEDELFAQGKVAKEPSVLLHMNVSIKEGEAEEAISGMVMGVEISPQGKLMALVIKGASKPVIYTEGTTHISPADLQS